MTELDNILAKLHTLTSAERATLVARAKMLGVFGDNSDKDAATFSDMLRDVTEKKWPPFSVVKRMRTYPKFVESVGVFNQFIDDVFGDLSRSQRTKIVVNLILCILDSFNRPVSLIGKDGLVIVDSKGREVKRRKKLEIWNVTWALNHIGEIVDNAYPSYLDEPGLLKVLILKGWRK